MVRNRDFDELENKINQIAETGCSAGDVSNHEEIEAANLLETAEMLVKMRPSASQRFKDKLKRELIATSASEQGMPLRDWSWTRFGAGIRRSQMVAIVAMLSLALLSSAALALPTIRELIFKPTTGNIILESKPAGVKVLLDGREKGATPLNLRELQTGNHRLSLIHENYEDWSGNVSVKENKTIKIMVEMTGIEVVELKGETKSKDSASQDSDSAANEEFKAITPKPEALVGQVVEPSTESESQTGNDNNTEKSATSGESSGVDSGANIALPPEEPKSSNSSFILAGRGNNLVKRDLSSGREETVTSLAQAIGESSIIYSGGKAVIQTSPGTIVIFDPAKGKSTVETLYEAKPGEAIVNPSFTASDTVCFGLIGKDIRTARLVQLQIGSDEPKVIYEGSAIGALQPGGQKTAYFENDGLYLIEQPGGQAKKVYAGGSVSKITWSPNGKKIAFIGPSKEPGNQFNSLFVIDSDGTDLLEVGRQPAVFKWSPSGQKLVYEAERSFRGGVFIFDTQTSAKSRMVDTAKYPGFYTDRYVCYIKNNSINVLDLDKLQEREMIKDVSYSTLYYISGINETD